MLGDVEVVDAEEALRAYPADGVVLLGGCDKTVPALMMGATSANLPAIFVPAGPMLRGNWRGQILGSGSDACHGHQPNSWTVSTSGARPASASGSAPSERA